MSEGKSGAPESFQWVSADWPDPMQELRDKAASGDKVAALAVKRVDAAVEAARPGIAKWWEDQWMNPPKPIAGGLADLLKPEGD